MADATLKCYIVSFEVGSDTVREKLRERLKAYGNFCPINKHCWAIRTAQKAVEVRDNLTEVLEPTDRIFVVRSGTEGAWRNPYGKENSEWLKKYL